MNEYKHFQMNELNFLGSAFFLFEAFAYFFPVGWSLTVEIPKPLKSQSYIPRVAMPVYLPVRGNSFSTYPS